MKKFVLCACMFLLLLSGCGGKSDVDPMEKGMDCTTLKVYNWGEYVGDGVIDGFQKEYGVKIIYEMFDSNEAMYTKLQSGETYDVLVPSDYMIERLMNEGKLQPLDMSLIPNFEGIMDGLKNPSYDPTNEYSVPYLWGTVGIIYNKEVVSLAELEEKGWNILKDPKYKGRVYMYDSERDSFMVALKALGYSMNTDDEKEIEEAAEWLRELDQNVDPVYVTDEVIDAMGSGSKDLAVTYSGEAAYVTDMNDKMGYYTPKEGTNRWVDGFVITKESKCPITANTFINYMLDEDNAFENTEYVGYTTTVQSVYDAEIDLGGYFYKNEAYQPRLGYDLDETFRHNEVLKKKLSQLWVKIKAQ
ncbi:MAG: ABC transporter substrate-binding protein [Erysipelotrichaceae bacterium]|nr:ABC transporter substrate-binding protein [Erysipelotrichaceae bacterium]